MSIIAGKWPCCAKDVFGVTQMLLVIAVVYLPDLQVAGILPETCIDIARVVPVIQVRHKCFISDLHQIRGVVPGGVVCQKCLPICYPPPSEAVAAHLVQGEQCLEDIGGSLRAGDAWHAPVLTGQHSTVRLWCFVTARDKPSCRKGHREEQDGCRQQALTPSNPPVEGQLVLARIGIQPREDDHHTCSSTVKPLRVEPRYSQYQ